jgi:transposase-like protein
LLDGTLDVSEEKEPDPPEITSSEARKLRAIPLLLSGMTITATAKEIGVRRETVHLWLKNEEFKSQLRKFKQESMQASINVLQAHSLELTNNLLRLSRVAVDDADRIRATTAALKLIQEHTVNEDVIARLDAIEASRVANKSGNLFIRIPAA